jgi:predicted AlkP superfamily pyrophosphatase or phosphodiesterase
VSKVILIVCDALRNDTAAQQMGYLEHLVEAKLASRYTVIAELPTMSRPLYETLHTGVPCNQHGITNNQVVRRSKMPNVFEWAVEHSKITAAAAYAWYSELYNRAPFNLLEDREVDDPTLPIQHGRFYSEDSYPDKEVFAAAGMLVRRFIPDYMLVHPMGMDYLGETYGADSSQYRHNAVGQDQIMSALIPGWLEAGYTILVTADHGINYDKYHGGTLPDVRHVPLYFIRPDGQGQGDTRTMISQLRIAPTVCHLLGLPIPETMKQPPLE